MIYNLFVKIQVSTEFVKEKKKKLSMIDGGRGKNKRKIGDALFNNALY